MFDSYRRYILNNADLHNGEEILSYWRDAKSEYLFKLMGIGEEQLILRKQVSYTRSLSEMSAMYSKIINTYYVFQRNLINTIASRIEDDKARLDASYRIESLFDSHRIYSNRITTKWEIKFNDGTKPFRAHVDQKVMSVIGELAQIADLRADYEAFREDIAKISSSKRTVGTLCLSIHPLDYATASDNNNGWHSCMSWENGGQYRMGTVEMMNSPMVICAYLASDTTPFNWHEGGTDHQWNNKKWRAWIIVHPNILLVNRNYPAPNDDLCREVLNWVRELAADNLGWHYGEPSDDCKWTKEPYCYRFETNLMYNDVARDNNWACLRDQKEEKPIHFLKINFSGDAQCMICGDRYYESDANTLVGPCCMNYTYCTECGAAIEREDEVQYDADGNPYCQDCFNDLFMFCYSCEEHYHTEDMTIVCIPTPTNYATNKYYMNERPCCPNCISDIPYISGNSTILDTRNMTFDEYIRDFGPYHNRELAKEAFINYTNWLYTVIKEDE